jgi:hypothetical protein
VIAHNVAVQKIGDCPRVAVRGFRLQIKAQHTVIEALGRVAGWFGRNPKLAARVFLPR